MQAIVLPYLGSALAVAFAGLAAMAISSVVVLPHVTVLMLAAVLFSATHWGLGPSLFAAVSSIAVSSFFFMPPIYSFAVHEPQDIVDLCVFAIVAVLTSNLAARVRKQAIEAKQRERRFRELHLLSRSLVGLLDPDELLLAMLGHFRSVLQRPVLLLLPRGKEFKIIPPDSRPLDDDARDAAERYWTGAKAQGSTLSAAGWDFHLLSSSRGPLCLLAIAQTENRVKLDEEPTDIKAMLEYATTIIERLM